MSTRPRRSDRRAWSWAAGALVALALAGGLVVWFTGAHLGADSGVYRAGALTFLRGEEVYSAWRLPTLPSWVALPFTYSPAAALLFVPLTIVPEGLTWGILAAVSVLSLAVVVRVCARSVRDSRLTSVPVLIGVTVLALGFEPVWKTIQLGQINLVLMAFVVLDVLVVSARGSRWGGVLIGVAGAIKLTPLIFVPHLFLTGRWRDGVRSIATFAVLQGVMFPLMPGDAARYWTVSAFDPSRIGSVYWSFNQSLNGMITRASAQAPWSQTLALAIAAVLAIPAAWLVWRLARRGEALAALAVTAFLGLVASPVSWSHHWVWSVPLVVLLLAKGRVWQGAVVAAFYLSALLMFIPNGGDTEFHWNAALVVLGNAYVVTAAAGLLVAAAVELRRDRVTEPALAPHPQGDAAASG
ncbi:glycosyltransferase 87 family protein [Amycolatopsis sp. CA-230715]|uniref:glycosyltransferase 87 family protein n=1 Tax=Amycolatopsis sp. CA-230715 TaxID=2745196 RepID=UPI001C0341AA|nr:glycosyltransferase 87 family protein [Amycolatopsis sp. CA-230715]QWF79290.1 hypothetical protein HUW46_02697 [Amycolatopsis sp. CA-230715]